MDNQMSSDPRFGVTLSVPAGASGGVGIALAPASHSVAISRTPAVYTIGGRISQGISQIAGHMTIDVVAAPGITLTTAARTALKYAAIYLGNLITDPISVTIAADILAQASTVGASALATSYQLPYASVAAEIKLHDPGVAAYIPTTLPNGAYGTLQVSKAEEKAWGVSLANTTPIDGEVYLNNKSVLPFNYSTSITPGNATFNTTDFVGLAEHELSHALGRITYNDQTVSPGVYNFGPLDLFRFLAPGTLQVDGVSSTANTATPYFSLNGGKTSLIPFYNVGRTDWLNPAANTTAYYYDAFNGRAPAYGFAKMTPLDVRELNAIGFNVACFGEGTRIATERGEIRVEDLVAGERVVTMADGLAPITWIGRRKIDIAAHPRPETVLPVLIRAGALDDGVPCRDLHVSPDHAFCLDGHLIPAKALLNGSSIRQAARPSITYYHVELARHGVLYAEAAPAESYLETGNRGAFDGVTLPSILYPDFGRTGRAQMGCAPFAEAGRVVEAVRARILARAAIATTADSGLTISYHDGAAIIDSRWAIPGNLSADPRDRRRLGVKIGGLSVAGRDIPIDHPALVEGWHDTEADGRWTDGRAVVPASLLGGGMIAVKVVAQVAYRRAAGL